MDNIPVGKGCAAPLFTDESTSPAASSCILENSDGNLSQDIKERMDCSFDGEGTASGKCSVSKPGDLFLEGSVHHLENERGCQNSEDLGCRYTGSTALKHYLVCELVGSLSETNIHSSMPPGCTPTMEQFQAVDEVAAESFVPLVSDSISLGGSNVHVPKSDVTLTSNKEDRKINANVSQNTGIKNCYVKLKRCDSSTDFVQKFVSNPSQRTREVPWKTKRRKSGHARKRLKVYHGGEIAKEFGHSPENDKTHSRSDQAVSESPTEEQTETNTALLKKSRNDLLNSLQIPAASGRTSKRQVCRPRKKRALVCSMCFGSKKSHPRGDKGLMNAANERLCCNKETRFFESGEHSKGESPPTDHICSSVNSVSVLKPNEKTDRSHQEELTIGMSKEDSTVQPHHLQNYGKGTRKRPSRRPKKHRPTSLNHIDGTDTCTRSESDVPVLKTEPMVGSTPICEAGSNMKWDDGKFYRKKYGIRGLSVSVKKEKLSDHNLETIEQSASMFESSPRPNQQPSPLRSSSKLLKAQGTIPNTFSMDPMKYQGKDNDLKRSLTGSKRSMLKRKVELPKKSVFPGPKASENRTNQSLPDLIVSAGQCGPDGLVHQPQICAQKIHPRKTRGRPRRKRSVEKFPVKESSVVPPKKVDIYDSMSYDRSPLPGQKRKSLLTGIKHARTEANSGYSKETHIKNSVFEEMQELSSTVSNKVSGLDKTEPSLAIPNVTHKGRTCSRGVLQIIIVPLTRLECNKLYDKKSTPVIPKKRGNTCTRRKTQVSRKTTGNIAESEVLQKRRGRPRMRHKPQTVKHSERPCIISMPEVIGEEPSTTLRHHISQKKRANSRPQTQVPQKIDDPVTKLEPEVLKKKERPCPRKKVHQKRQRPHTKPNRRGRYTAHPRSDMRRKGFQRSLKKHSHKEINQKYPYVPLPITDQVKFGKFDLLNEAVHGTVFVDCASPSVFESCSEQAPLLSGNSEASALGVIQQETEDLPGAPSAEELILKVYDDKNPGKNIRTDQAGCQSMDSHSEKQDMASVTHEEGSTTFATEDDGIFVELQLRERHKTSNQRDVDPSSDSALPVHSVNHNFLPSSSFVDTQSYFHGYQSLDQMRQAKFHFPFTL